MIIIVKIPYLLLLDIGITLFNEVALFVSLDKKIKETSQIRMGNNATIVCS